MSQALTPTIEPAVPAPPALTLVDYEPKAKDWAFLQAVQEAIDTEGKADCPTIARKLGQSKQAVWKRLQDPKFAAWVNQEMRRAVDEMWSRVLYRAAVLSVKGSIKHMDFLAKVRGEFAQRDPDDAPGGGSAYNVTILIPGS